MFSTFKTFKNLGEHVNTKFPGPNHRDTDMDILGKILEICINKLRCYWNRRAMNQTLRNNKVPPHWIKKFKLGELNDFPKII